MGIIIGLWKYSTKKTMKVEKLNNGWVIKKGKLFFNMAKGWTEEATIFESESVAKHIMEMEKYLK